jgi:hypothetical protein
MARQVEWQSCFVRAATLCLFPDIEPEFGCFQWNIALIFTLSRTLKPAVSMAQPNKIQIPPPPPVPPNCTQGHPTAPKHRQRGRNLISYASIRFSKNSPFTCKGRTLLYIVFYSPTSSALWRGSGRVCPKLQFPSVMVSEGRRARGAGEARTSRTIPTKSPFCHAALGSSTETPTLIRVHMRGTPPAGFLGYRFSQNSF